ncbi:MAG TPA: type II toxin-antitoxin system PemK/MazF family toxin [Bryobacteraceae bacterium]|nr:type II toxin-antitoxin system PemK/MazF family toxin [Bryobacteraceae bacterium]
MAAKTRPVLVVSVPYRDDDRALITVVPHTTSLRSSSFEIRVAAPFLRPGAFLVQGISTYPRAGAVRRLGLLRPEHFTLVMDGVARWLGLATQSNI